MFQKHVSLVSHKSSTCQNQLLHTEPSRNLVDRQQWYPMAVHDLRFGEYPGKIVAIGRARG